jgi:hypothetical protein
VHKFFETSKKTADYLFLKKFAAKDDLVKRQLNESDSLYAVQKMDFQTRLRELKELNKAGAKASSLNGPLAHQPPMNNTFTSAQMLHFQQSDLHVPIVHVNSKFELIDICV